ncbi:MAG: YwmB family TATA-box binding protein [Acetivibrio ethanolgignens]
MEALTSEIFAEKKAESVQGITGNGIFSAYGYSPLLPQNVISEGKRINLNVVSSYNEETDTTKIIVASPIYNEDY